MKIADCDYFVVGSGMAGLMNALHLASYGKVVLVTKGRLQACNTNFAQGGICGCGKVFPLVNQDFKVSYPKSEKMRRVKARVKVDGKWRTMVFLTNNFEWAASTVADLYKARWEVELLFKELKQTLQLQDFYGENAVEWQIWAALLAHLVLRWLKFKAGAACSYSRFAAIVRAIVWLKKDAMAILRSYGIAPPPDSGGIASGMPYLHGFEKMFLMSVG